MKFGLNVRKTRIESTCFSFHVVLLFYQLSSFKPDTENNVNFNAVSSKCANFDEVLCNFLKHIPKLINLRI